MKAHTLFEKIAHSNPVDFGVIFSKSIELFKKVWVDGLVYALISSVIISPIIVLIFVLPWILSLFPILPLLLVRGEQSGVDPEMLFGGMSLIIFILSAVVIVVLFLLLITVQVALLSHFYLVCKHKDIGNKENLGYFVFLKKEYFAKTCKLSTLITVILIISMVFCFVPLFYVMVPLSMVPVLYAFHPNKSVLHLIKASFKLGNKYWITIFGLVIFAIILSQAVGMLMCFLGTILTTSFTHIPCYYIYKDAIGFDEDNFSDEFDEISALKS